MKSLSQIKIRKATKKDLDGIYQLFLELIKSEEVSAEKVARFLRDIRKKRKDFEESSKKELSKDICGKNSILFVAEDKNEIIGYISGDILKVKDPFFNPIILGYLNHIIILKNYRGKGVSEKLYLELEKIFKKRKCTVCSLEVFSTNPAVKTFEKFGYKITTHKMWKKLK